MRRAPGSMEILRRLGLGAVGVSAVLGATELALWADGVSSTVFPQPSTVVQTAVSIAGSGAFWAAVGSTMSAWAKATVITVLVAVPAGALLGLLPRAELALRPVLEFLRPIPAVVLFPLVLLIAQDEGRTEVAVIVFAAVWPVLVNTSYGFREVDPAAKETLRAFGFGPLGVAWHVSLPSAAPFIATGVRIAASTGFVVAIAAELVGTGLNGLGAYVGNEQGAASALAVMLAVALWCGIIGLAVNAAFGAVQRRAFRWHLELTAAPAGAAAGAVTAAGAAA